MMIIVDHPVQLMPITTKDVSSIYALVTCDKTSSFLKQYTLLQPSYI